MSKQVTELWMSSNDEIIRGEMIIRKKHINLEFCKCENIINERYRP